MNTNELNQKYHELYQLMAQSNKQSNMESFGNVMTEMMSWMIGNKPEMAKEWIEELEAIKWENYLTSKEAEEIVSGMDPGAPWTRERWKSTMEQRGYQTEEHPCYNSCSLWVAMNMIMSDSSETIDKYVSQENLFAVVHDLAVDKLTDKDKRFNIRRYFGLQ